MLQQCAYCCFSAKGSAIRYNRTCWRSNWCNRRGLHTALSLTPRCSDLSSFPSSPLQRCSAFHRPCARSLPRMTGEEEQQLGQAPVPLPESCISNGGVYAASLTLRLISALLDMQSGLVKRQSAKLYYSSVGGAERNFRLACFFFLSRISSSRLKITFWPTVAGGVQTPLRRSTTI